MDNNFCCNNSIKTNSLDNNFAANYSIIRYSLDNNFHCYYSINIFIEISPIQTGMFDNLLILLYVLQKWLPDYQSFFSLMTVSHKTSIIIIIWPSWPSWPQQSCWPHLICIVSSVLINPMNSLYLHNHQTLSITFIPLTHQTLFNNPIISIIQFEIS